MKTIFEAEDIEALAQAVIERLRPLLSSIRVNEPDEIFTVQTLAKYLSVEPTWVYKAVSLKEIPYFKVGKYTRFKKSVIDKWVEMQAVRPIPALKNMTRHREAS